MRAGRWIAAALILTQLFPACALAESRAYGGRGEDLLLALTEAGGGLFAAGMTASADGDLAMRTRTGDTGWAMLLDESGERLWSYASAHTGMARMTEPAALDDGRYSLVLTDETLQRAEWLLLDDDGKALSRKAVSPALLNDGQGYSVRRYLLAAQQPPALAMILQNGESWRAVTLDESGAVLDEAAFTAEGQGLAAGDRLGKLAWIGADQGELDIIWLNDMHRHHAALSGAQAISVADMLMQADGSVVCCGEANAGGTACGFLARVSREGELLFEHLLPLVQLHVCQTETGFAAYGCQGEEARVVFVDEDGAVLDTASGVPADALDLAGSPGGAALLTHVRGSRQPQAVITRVTRQEKPEEPEEEPKEEAPGEDDTHDVRRFMAGAPIQMEEGYLVCGQSDGYGVQVSCMDGSGAQRWSTRIPIHTAADALEWLCALQMADGGILLGGRYLTGSGESAGQEGVVAQLSGDGVLRKIETIAGAGAVCAMTFTPDGCIMLHAAKSTVSALEPDMEIAYPR